MVDNLTGKAFGGAIWASIDRFGSMIIQFIINIVLTHLLFPEDFGMIGMLTIFIVVSQTLVDGGFGSALIQKKEPSAVDYSTIFFWNLIFSVILYLLLFCLSEPISRFYEMPMLSKVLRVMALSLILTGVYSIQRTRLQKMLAFKKIAYVNLSAYILGAIIAIGMAYGGCGVWSLVGMQLGYGFFSVILMTVITRWIPKEHFSKKSLRELFGFGGFIMAANILQTICQNLQGILIGKRFSATQMGYYTQAYKLDQITSYSIPQVIVQVMYPIYASVQDNQERLNKIVLMNLRVIAFLIYPILSILMLSSDFIIDLLYGSKWSSSAPYFRVLCIGGFFVCLQNINYYAVAAIGKSKSLFRWSFYKWGFLLLALIVGMFFGMYGILWGMVVSNLNIFLVNAYLMQKNNKLSIYRQIRAIIPILVITGVSFSLGMGLKISGTHILYCCVVLIATYIIVSCVLKVSAYKDTMKIISQVIRK